MVVESWIEMVRSELTNGGYLRWRRDSDARDVLVVSDILLDFPSAKTEVNELIKPRSIGLISYHTTDDELMGSATINTKDGIYRVHFFKGRIHGLVERTTNRGGGISVTESRIYVDGKPISYWY
jgi:hypothetical protein